MIFFGCVGDYRKGRIGNAYWRDAGLGFRATFDAICADQRATNPGLVCIYNEPRPSEPGSSH